MCLLGLVLFYRIIRAPAVLTLHLRNWIQLDLLSVGWDFQVDSLSVFMVLLIALIGTIVNFYSLDYMYGDSHDHQFIGIFGIFSFAMNGLVMSQSLGVLFFSWELVGLNSYLLICFWRERQQSLRSGFKAVLYNKIGDVYLFIAIGCAFEIIKTFDLDLSSLLLPYFKDYKERGIPFSIHIFDITWYALIIAAFTKSAQWIFSGWLTEAMGAPTPVSALLHAATMVTAGNFLLLRGSALWTYDICFNYLVPAIGGLTALSAGIAASIQSDKKKIIGYSTTSQLG